MHYLGEVVVGKACCCCFVARGLALAGVLHRVPDFFEVFGQVLSRRESGEIRRVNDGWDGRL